MIRCFGDTTICISRSLGDGPEHHGPILFLTLGLDDREEAVRKIQKYDLFALPVVDTNGILLGVVKADNVLDVAEEEATEDIQ